MTEKEIRSALVEYFGASCWGCTDNLPERQLVLDHIIPKADGGSDEIYNRALLCSPCNSKKGDRLTLSALRVENKVKDHPVNLKAAMPLTREQFLKGFTKQFELPTADGQRYSQSELSVPDYGGNCVRGLRELQLLLHIRGCEEIAIALRSVVGFKAYNGGWNNGDTYAEMTVGDIYAYNYLKQEISADDHKKLWDAICEIEGAVIYDRDSLYVTLRPYIADPTGNDRHDPYGDDIDDLPF
jgi:hypothetical protein